MDLISIKKKCSSLLPYTYGFFLGAFFLAPSSKSLNNLFYLTVLAPALPLFWDQFSKLFKNNIPFRIIVFFILYCSLSVFWSPTSDFGKSLRIFRHAIYPLIFTSITIHLFETKPKAFEKIFTWLIVAAVIGAAVNTFMWYKDNPFPNSRIVGWGRIDNPIVLGCSYGLVAIITAARAFKATAKTDIFIYLTATIALFIFINLTQSRLALISLFITLLAIVVIRLNRKTVIFLIAAVMTTAIFLLLEPELVKRYLDKTALERFFIWKQVFFISMDKPFFGHGILDRASASVHGITYRTPHSIYIGTFFYFGIFGMLTLIYIIFSALRLAFNYAKQSKDYVLFLLCIFGLLCLAGDFGILLDHPSGPWLLFWLPISLAVSQSKRNEKAVQRKSSFDNALNSKATIDKSSEMS